MTRLEHSRHDEKVKRKCQRERKPECGKLLKENAGSQIGEINCQELENGLKVDEKKKNQHEKKEPESENQSQTK